MHNLYSISFTFHGPVSFFVYGLLIPKDKIISFHQFRVLYDNFGDMNTLYQLCVLIDIFTAYICVHYILASVCASVCVSVYIILCMNELCIYVFIVGQ